MNSAETLLVIGGTLVISYYLSTIYGLIAFLGWGVFLVVWAIYSATLH
jgi:uncharacterized membrane protein